LFPFFFPRTKTTKYQYKKRGKMSIKFIHCADVHLGSPLVAASKEKKDLLNDAIENALKNQTKFNF
jgi:hypothetical protein